jgi:hypothetical protein
MWLGVPGAQSWGELAMHLSKETNILVMGDGHRPTFKLETPEDGLRAQEESRWYSSVGDRPLGDWG